MDLQYFIELLGESQVEELRLQAETLAYSEEEYQDLFHMFLQQAVTNPSHNGEEMED